MFLSLIILFIMIISMLLLILNMILSKKKYLDREKLSSFECGFMSMSSSRLPFSIHFYLIGILFLIFDVEIIFLFSFLVLLDNLLIKEWIYLSLLIFFILYLGLEYEKSEGSLKWIF